MFPLIGKLKTMTKKKPYLFTSCFHSGGEQETLWVYYLASCECKDVRPRYVFVCSGGRVITQGAVPLAVSTQAQRLCPTQPCPHAAWLGNAAGLGYRAALLWQICPGQDLTHSSPRAFVFLFMLLSLLLFILMIFFFFSHPLLPVGCLSSGALKVSLVLWTWHKGTSLLCPSASSPCLHEGLIAAAFVTEPADGMACFFMQVWELGEWFSAQWLGMQEDLPRDCRVFYLLPKLGPSLHTSPLFPERVQRCSVGPHTARTKAGSRIQVHSPLSGQEQDAEKDEVPLTIMHHLWFPQL